MPLALDLSGFEILVVDDDPTFRRILHRTLTELGARVTEVEAGARGVVELKRAREEGSPYQAIFLDTTLAGVNGFEIAALLREHPQELRRVILVLGPEIHPSELSRASEIGVGGHLVKPLNRPDLVRTLAAVTGAPEVVREPAPGSPRVRILLAEDSSDSRQIIRH
ncbi:MAG: response regulator, partial [Candidatus Binatia bacterium]